MCHPVASLFCLLIRSQMLSLLFIQPSTFNRKPHTLMQSVPLHGLCPSMHCTRPRGSVAPPLRHMTSCCSQEQTIQLKTHK